MTISSWIIRKRKLLFLLTMAFALLSVFFLFRVRVNRDMTGYLPPTSPMKQGVEILQEEWDELELSLRSPVGSQFPGWIIPAEAALVIVILILAGSSLAEPFLCLAVTGTAVLINMGTNCFLPDGVVSDITFSIAAFLQIILTLDYAIILSNRFSQENRAYPGHEMFPENALKANALKAMTGAVRASLKPVAGSGLTTIAGTLMLVCMSFRIGDELGIVMAKGALCSMVCTFTMLPFLLLRFQGFIGRTAKRPLRLPAKAISAFGARYSRPILLVFVVLAVLALILRSGTAVSITLDSEREKKTGSVAILVYENEDEASVDALLDELNGTPEVNAAIGWGNTFGDYPTKVQMLLHAPELIKLFRSAKGLQGLLAGGTDVLGGTDEAEESDASDVSDMQGESGAADGSDAQDEEDDSSGDIISRARSLLKSDTHSLVVLDLNLDREDEDVWAFFDRLDMDLKESMSGRYHLIGESVMAWEMSKTFGREMNRIALLTAGAIFLILLLIFRSLVIPVVLVPVVLTAVFFAMVINWPQGSIIAYQAFLAVQGILMGAMVDYAIVYAAHYREARNMAGVTEAVGIACRDSINTVMTPSVIIIATTLLLGSAFPNPIVASNSFTISMGAAITLALIILFLPGILAALDNPGKAANP